MTHILLRLYLYKKEDKFPEIKISYFDKESLIESESITPDNIPGPFRDGKIEVHYEYIKDIRADTIEWSLSKERKALLNLVLFKLRDTDLQFNEVWLCSKNIPIQRHNLFLVKRTDSIDGFRYMTVVYGDILDDADNVSDASESVRDHIVQRQSFLNMRRIEAQRRKARALWFRHSQSLANLRQRLSQPMVLSTIQRLGRTTKVLAASERLTISKFTWRMTRWSAALNCGPR